MIKLNWHRVWENTLAIFFAFIPMMILCGIIWFITIMSNSINEDYLGEYQESVMRQDIKLSEQNEYIEILRTQMSQVKSK